MKKKLKISLKENGFSSFSFETKSCGKITITEVTTQPANIKAIVSEPNKVACFISLNIATGIFNTASFDEESCIEVFIEKIKKLDF